MQDRLNELWATGRQTSIERVAAVETAISNLLMGHQMDLSEAIGAAHKLAGTLGMFGRPGGSALARRIELALEGDELDQATVIELSELTVELRRSVESSADSANSNNIASTSEEQSGPLVYLVGPDQSYMEALRLGTIQHGFSAERDVEGDQVGDSGADVVIFNVRHKAPSQDLMTQLRDSDAKLLVGLGAEPSSFTLAYMASLGLDLIVCEPVDAVAAASLIKDEYARYNDAQSIAFIGSPATAERLGSLVSRWSFDPTELEVLVTSAPSRRVGVVAIEAGPDPRQAARTVRMLRTIEATRALQIIVLDRISPTSDSVSAHLLPHDADVIISANPDPVHFNRVLDSATLKAASGAKNYSGTSAISSADWETTAHEVDDLIERAGQNGSGLALLHLSPVSGDTADLTRSQTVVRSSVSNGSLFDIWADGVLIGLEAEKVEANETLQRLVAELGHSGIETKGSLSVLGDDGTTGDALMSGLHRSSTTSDDQSARSSSQVASADRPSTILVIEDDPLVSSVVLDLITGAGYQVELEADGLSAADLVCDSNVASRFAMVIMDISLPGLDGFGILRRMQRAATTGLVPVLLLTARANESETVMGLELGASDHVAKPFSPQVLLRRIERLLKQ